MILLDKTSSLYRTYNTGTNDKGIRQLHVRDFLKMEIWDTDNDICTITVHDYGKAAYKSDYRGATKKPAKKSKCFLSGICF